MKSPDWWQWQTNKGQSVKTRIAKLVLLVSVEMVSRTDEWTSLEEPGLRGAWRTSRGPNTTEEVPNSPHQDVRSREGDHTAGSCGSCGYHRFPAADWPASGQWQCDLQAGQLNNNNNKLVLGSAFAAPILREGEVVGCQRWKCNGSFLWLCNLPSNVSNTQINKGGSLWAKILEEVDRRNPNFNASGRDMGLSYAKETVSISSAI